MPPRPPSSLGHNLRAFRERAGLTQLSLAEKAGVSLATVSKVEGGQTTHVRRETAGKLAAALGARLQDLVAPETAGPLEEILSGLAGEIPPEFRAWLGLLPPEIWTGLRPSEQTIRLLRAAYFSAQPER